ncbi:MAG: RdgB/HAM1 family non-canonical purine NTP pyrophosphatase [Chthonomonadales bacterium]
MRAHVKYPRRLLIATRNRPKAVEMATILKDVGVQIATLDDVFPSAPEVEENGTSYEENALLKARSAADLTGLVAIADDAGLEIDALGGEPGVHSRRFLGEDTPFPQKMERILQLLEDTPDEARTCRFRCAVAIAVPHDGHVICTGTCEGRVAREMRGAYGFGYDPIFYLPSLGRHMAELPPEEKHRISHRGKALACAKEHLTRIFNDAGMDPRAGL